jgi:hypothetical protein
MQPNDTPTAHVLQNGSAKCIQFTIHMGINQSIPHDLNLLQLQIRRHAPSHMCPNTSTGDNMMEHKEDITQQIDTSRRPLSAIHLLRESPPGQLH